MTCCINPDCQQPQNLDTAETCQSCGSALISLLRGRYRVVQPIGQGGFGRTYLATDEDRLKAPCVIKQFSPQFKGVQSLEKALMLFEEEAKRLFELGEHPQIPALLAYFEHDRRLYLVQQFIEGITLAQEVQRQGYFDEQKIREMLFDLLPVLHYVHERQVIHRDITPGNIIRKQQDNQLVLIDFGVAKQLGDSANNHAGTKIGTEGYSPIEQWRSGRAYPASDIYSLATTCLYLMTQLRPDILYDPLTGQWLWRENLQKRNIAVSDGFSKILDKMLKDLVSERYQSAFEVLQELKAIATGSAAIAAASIPTDGRRLPPLEAGLIKVSMPKSSGPKSSGPKSSSNTARSGMPSHKGDDPPRQTPPPVSASNQPWVCLRTLTGHSSWVTTVAMSPDGETLASGGLDDTIRIWHYPTGELLRTLRGHTRAVNCLAISPNGRLLVSGSDDTTIRVWNIQTGALLFTLSEHTRDVSAVAISEDGRLLLSGSSDRTIRLWNLGKGELLRVYAGATGIVKAVAITSDRQTLLSAGLDNKIHVWTMNTGDLQRTILGHHNPINSLALAPNGTTIVSGSKDKTIRLWHLPTGDLIGTILGHNDSVNTVIVNPGGQTIISGSSDRTIKFWNLRTGNLLYTLAEHTDTVNAMGISPDGQTIASGSNDKTIRIWQMT